MKRTIIIFYILGLVNIISCTKDNNFLKDKESQIQEQDVDKSNDGIANNSEESIIEFDEENYDFKEIKKGEEVTHVFKFTNVGKGPLVISKVQPSCGCTTPQYTKEPVAPGKKGAVTVTFDSSNFEGSVYKTVTVMGNFKTKTIKFQAKIN